MDIVDKEALPRPISSIFCESKIDEFTLVWAPSVHGPPVAAL